MKRRGDPGRSQGLTDKEFEVLWYAAQGCTNRQIAKELGIGNQTAKNHMTHIMQKMGVYSRTGAAIVAIQLGWIDVSKLRVSRTWEDQ